MAESWQPVVLRALYRGVTWLMVPLALAYFYWRGAREPNYRQGWSERLGRVPGRSDQPLWVHAASVGEVGLAEPVVRALHAHYPQRAIIVTTFTPTGADRVQARLGDVATHCYVPLDTAGATRRFMQRVRPSCGIIVETELWPNLLHSAARTQVPILLINASISARSAKRYRNPALAPLIRQTMAAITAVGVASQQHAERFIELGAPASRVRVTGNLKYDIKPDSQALQQGMQWRDQWHAQQRPVWVAASTHDGEDELILAAHRRLRKCCNNVLLVLAPRHPQRFQAVADLLEHDGWCYAAHANNEPVDADTEVILGNTLGDVPKFYSAADVAFVGGSLVAGIGGHNVLEAALLARPVLVGPHIGEWQEIMQTLVTAEGAVIVQTSNQLADQVEQWLMSPGAARSAGRRAQNAAQEQQGALARTLELFKLLA